MNRTRRKNHNNTFNGIKNGAEKTGWKNRKMKPCPSYKECLWEFVLNERQAAINDLSEMVKKSVFERIDKVGKGIACQLP